MSSSNLERLAYIKEVTLGVTPVGPFNTIRYISESLSGNPQTVESAEARSDRASGGTLLTGLTVEGNIEAELSSSESSYKDFLLGGMMWPSWTASTSSTSTYAVDNTAKTITDTGAGTDLTTILTVGGAVVLRSPFVLNLNKIVYVSAVTATVITYIGNLQDETVVGAILGSPEYAEVGGGATTTAHSFTIEMNFLDLTQKAIDYLGSLVAGFTLNFEYGALAALTLAFNAQNWKVPAIPITDPPAVVNPPDDDIPINSSGDMGAIIIDGIDQDLCFQSLTIELNNNLTPQTCLGLLTAKDFVPGSATITVTANLYLGDSSFQYVSKKITNTPISIFFSATNADGGVAGFLPKVLLNSPDPASPGKDQEILLNLTGSAAAPTPPQNQFRLYWI